MSTTLLLIISAIYGPVIFTLYLAQLVIVIVNKRKPQFRSSYFSLFIISAITGLASFLVTIVTYKLPSFPEVNSFYAHFPVNGFTTALYFSIYYFAASEEYANIFIALNRLSAITMYNKYEEIWSRFGWVCLPVIFGFPFISYYHLVDVQAYFRPTHNGTVWAMDYDHSARPWRSNRVATFYLSLATSTTTLALNLASLIALRCVSKEKRSTAEIRLFLLGITSFVCGLPVTYQQLVFMFTTSGDEMTAMLNRLPWLSDLKALAPSLLSLVFSPAIRNELIRVLTRRNTYNIGIFTTVTRRSTHPLITEGRDGNRMEKKKAGKPRRERPDDEIAERTRVFLEKRRKVEDSDLVAKKEVRCDEPVPTRNECEVVRDDDTLDTRVLRMELRARRIAIEHLERERSALNEERDNLQCELGDATMIAESLESRLSNMGISFEKECLRGKAVRSKYISQVRSEAASTPRRIRNDWDSLDSRSRVGHRERLARAVTPLVTDSQGDINVVDLRKILGEVFAIVAPGQTLYPSLSTEEDLAMVKKTGLRWKGRLVLQQELLRAGSHSLATYNSVYALNKAKVAEFKDFFECGYAVLDHKDSSGESVVGPSGYARVKKERFAELVSNECERMYTEGLMHFDEFDEKVWLAFQSDKGGGSVKSGLSIMNTKCANSPFYVVPICTFYGEESYINYREVMTPLFLEMREMKTVKVAGVNRTIVWQGIADFACKNVLCGLKSTSHSYPCAECEYKIGTVADENTVQRTSERLKECLDEYQDLFLNGAKEDDAAKTSRGVIEESVLPFPPKNFTTSQVHILTGPGAQLLSYLEGVAITKDLADSGSTRELHCMEDRAKIEKVLNADLRTLADRVKNFEIAVADCGRIEKVLGGSLSATTLACGSPLCLHGSLFKGRSKLRRAQAWATATCGECSRGFHGICIGKVTDEMYESATMKCPQCMKWDRARVAAEIQSNIEQAKHLLNDAMNDQSLKEGGIKREINLIRGRGQWYTALKKYMSGKGVSRALWFQSYTGREVRSILKAETLEACFELIELPQTGTLWNAMCSFRDVVEMAKPRFLTNNEIENVEKSVLEFIKCYRLLNVTADRSVKFHYLDAHFLPYLREFRTFGLATEQAVEHFHALFNEYEGRFQCLGNPGSRLARIMIEHLISSPYVRKKDNVDSRRRGSARPGESIPPRRPAHSVYERKESGEGEETAQSGYERKESREGEESSLYRKVL